MSDTSVAPDDGGQSRPATKTARHARIRQILSRTQIRSQNELARILAADGFAVTQATLSRDLIELRADKIRTSDGELVYAAAADAKALSQEPVVEQLAAGLARRCAELLVSASASANLVVLRTPPGAAQFLASAIDDSVLPGVLGTIAGDDTVLVIVASAKGGSAMARRFLEMAQAG